MADDQQSNNDGIVHYEAGIPVFNTRLDNLENEAREAKNRDKEYKDEQLKLNRRLVIFTGVLAAVGIIGGAISAYQTHIAGINADAAQKNATAAQANAQAAKAQADASRQTVEEMKKSGLDTHALAEAPKAQADAATKFAASAEGIRSETANAVSQLKRSATESENAIKQTTQNAQDALTLSVNITNLEQRPWIGHYGTIITRFDKNGVRARVVFFNSGRTPARGILGSAQMLVLPGQFRDCPDNPVHEKLGAVAPQSMLTLTQEHTFDQAGKMDFDTYDRVTNTAIPEDKASYLYVCGSIAYWDNRGVVVASDGTGINPHVTAFCLVYDRVTKEFGICEAGNDMR